MMKRNIAYVAIALSLPASASANRIIFTLPGWTIVATEDFTCDVPPVLHASGAGSLFDERNVGALHSITLGIARALSRQCPELADVVISTGRTRRLVSLPRSGAGSSTPLSASSNDRLVGSSLNALGKPADEGASAVARDTSLPPRLRGGVNREGQDSQELGGEVAAAQARGSLASRPASRAAPPIDLFGRDPANGKKVTMKRFKSSIGDDPAKASMQQARCAALVSWAKQLKNEHPEFGSEDGGQAAMIRGMKLAKLFSDVSFIPVFGKAYDELTENDKELFRDNTGAPCSRDLWSAAPAVAGLLGTYPRLPEVYARAIQAGREARSMLDKIRLDITGTHNAFLREDILNIEESFEQTKPLLWPSEIRRFIPLLQDAWDRVSPDDKAPDVIVAAQPGELPGRDKRDYMCGRSGAHYGKVTRAREILAGQTIDFFPYRYRDLYDGARSGKPIEITFSGTRVNEVFEGASTSSAVVFDDWFWVRSVPGENRDEHVTIVQMDSNPNVQFLARTRPKRDGDRCAMELLGTVSWKIQPRPILLPGEFRARRTPIRENQ